MFRYFRDFEFSLLIHLLKFIHLSNLPFQLQQDFVKQIFGFKIFGNIQVLFYIFSKLSGKKKSVKCASPLLLNMTLINPVENYAHIIESHFCIL